MSERLNRREFVQVSAAAGAAALCSAAAVDAVLPASAGAASPLRMKEAMYYEKLSQRRIRCKVCPKQCEVGDRERGFCGSRENREGTYYTLVYGSAGALNIDPIEKKPLFHFLPQSRALSFGTAGCNFDCKNCQNWSLSQSRPEQVDSQHLPPEKAVELAKSQGCKVIAYTYTEPVTFYEYMHDTARAAKAAGLASVMISNGYINRDPMVRVAQYLDAVKIDFKGVTEEFYKRYCVGTLQPVLDTMNRVKKLGKWLEVVYLVIPGLNDSPGELGKLASWVKQYLGRETPLHFSRFIPQYRMKNIPPTPQSTLERCHDIAREAGLDYVYLGNVPGHKYESTFCPGCGKVLVERLGLQVRRSVIEGGKCPHCGRAIAGVWK